MSRRPPIDPVRRKLAPWPERAHRNRGAGPFPPCRRLPLSGPAPEDVVVDAAGGLVTGLGDGRLVRLDPATGQEETLGSTGGRPLGLELTEDGRIIICDAYKGLLRLDSTSGEIETLVSKSNDGRRLRFCSNATLAPDGSIWFTESTDSFDFEHYLGAVLEHRPSGHLFRLDPDGDLEHVLESLHFPNGLTVSEDGSALYFVETDGYRLSKFRISAPGAGQLEVVADNLPGFPDNVSRMKDGRFWVAMAGPRKALLDRLGATHPFWRKLLWHLPEGLTPGAAPTAWVMAFDGDGRVVADFQSSDAGYRFVTGVAQTAEADRLYLASLHEEAILELDLEPDLFRTHSSPA